MRERRQLLEDNVKPIDTRIHISEMTPIASRDDLETLMTQVLQEGLEGLVLKDEAGVYVPGMRRWLKMKKDYLKAGSMADSADLVVLGAYYGTGNKGGLMATFLMGAYDEKEKRWKTVCKAGNGHSDAMINKLQKQLDMVPVNKDINKIPKWLSLKNGEIDVLFLSFVVLCPLTILPAEMLPDFVSADPEKSQIWEISGFQFTHSKRHTADNISIRFPRVTRVRTDKKWQDATSVVSARTVCCGVRSSRSCDAATTAQACGYFYAVR